jgi:hypothetical protein
MSNGRDGKKEEIIGNQKIGINIFSNVDKPKIDP